MLRFDNSYARELDGFYVVCPPSRPPNPKELYYNAALADTLGFVSLSPDQRLRWFSGMEVPEGAQPIAQAYAGHQFGGFSTQLGDGRALLLGEVLDPAGNRFDIAFKGSGRTPFSRGGDGKAAVGPMLREVLISEGLAALGVPTTRSLAVVATGEEVYRMEPLPGAVLTRVAASHLRVGTFEFFAARRATEQLRRLADYAIARHYPSLKSEEFPVLAFFQAVCARQARLIAQWMNLGFIHGVMNTDNMTISGESIDFGPCAFMEAYDPATVFSSIDHGGRYAFGKQPTIARWNLARLAEALLPVLHPDEPTAVRLATGILESFLGMVEEARLEGQRQRLALDGGPRDASLIEDWLSLLQQQKVDYTLASRRLAEVAEGRDDRLAALFPAPGPLRLWLQRWKSAGTGDRAARIRAACPAMIPRNHRVEAALTAASLNGDLAPFETLLAAVQRPFEEPPAGWELPASPAFTEGYQTFCGT